MNSAPNMLDRARAIQDQLVAWRRDFHMHPELGFKELRTSAKVAETLLGLGCRVRSGVGRTGVVADLGEGSPVVAIRADMDALPILEANLAPYASTHPGIMHACGHDAHTAILLGVAQILSQEKLPGSVRFLFQPSEEQSDEQGISGAPRMIEDGAMQGVDTVLALHTDPIVATGSISVDSGPYSAGVDTFYATIIGKGGHGAMPHRVVDPIYLAGHVILALHGIVSRRLHPFDPAVISIGTIHGGQLDNIIPEQVELSGTIRFLSTDVQKQLHAEIQRAFEVARTLGGDYRLRLEIGYPPQINDPGVVEAIRRAAGGLLGEEHLVDRRNEMGAEDFGFFSSVAPGAMFRLGAQITSDERKQHSPRFDIDEGCLPIGAAVLAQTALQILKESRDKSEARG